MTEHNEDDLDFSLILGLISRALPSKKSLGELIDSFINPDEGDHNDGRDERPKKRASGFAEQFYIKNDMDAWRTVANRHLSDGDDTGIMACALVTLIDAYIHARTIEEQS